MLPAPARGNDKFACPSSGGNELRVEPVLHPIHSPSSVHHHDWILAAEMDLVRFAVSATEKCELAFDVGMNYGFYSQLFAAQGCECCNGLVVDQQVVEDA